MVEDLVENDGIGHIEMSFPSFFYHELEPIPSYLIESNLKTEKEAAFVCTVSVPVVW